jgi:predicted Zn-dependent protease
MKRGAALVLLLSTMACDQVTPPDRPTPYRFAIQLENGFPLVFRWPAASLPVRVWTEPALSMEAHTIDALALWEADVLYAEVRGILVDDSATADILIRLGEPEPPGPGDLPCRSWTWIAVGLDTAIELPFRTVIQPRVGASSQDLHACLRQATAHELGHAFGLFLESDDPADLMYPSPSPRGLSVRDIVTLETLYHSQPTVHLPASR